MGDPDEAAALTTHPPAKPPASDAPPSLAAFREAVAERFGLLFTAEDEPWLAHRLVGALGPRAFTDDRVARQVRGGAAAAERVAAAVAPLASTFGGEDPAIRAMPTIAGMVPRPLGQPLVLWSLGCGAGAEGYGALFALADAGVQPVAVRLYGADLVEGALERARLGGYEARECAVGLPSAWCEAYMDPGDGAWRVKAAWREAARWVRANLLEPLPPMPRPDVVLCRDVLGWLGEPARRQALASVAERLADRGMLLVAPSEAELVQGPFEPLGEALPGAFRRTARGG